MSHWLAIFAIPSAVVGAIGLLLSWILNHQRSRTTAGISGQPPTTFYRSRRHKVIAGVCSALAQRWHQSLPLIRIVAVALKENRNRGHSMSKVFFPLRRLSHRKSLLYGSIAVLLALFTGCVFNLGGIGVRGSGIIKTESRSVSGFSSIVFNSEGKVTVQQTGKESLTINAEDNLLPLLESRVTDRILPLAKPTGGNRHGE